MPYSTIWRSSNSGVVSWQGQTGVEVHIFPARRKADAKRNKTWSVAGVPRAFSQENARIPATINAPGAAKPRPAMNYYWSYYWSRTSIVLSSIVLLKFSFIICDRTLWKSEFGDWLSRFYEVELRKSKKKRKESSSAWYQYWYQRFDFYFLTSRFSIYWRRTSIDYLVALKIAEISTGDNALIINADFAQNLNIQTRSATTPLLDDRPTVE
jgi:hypothetical protein